jgi:hypothetical protein
MEETNEGSISNWDGYAPEEASHGRGATKHNNK